MRSTIWALSFTIISIIGLGALLTALEVSRWSHRSVTEVTGFDPLLYSFAGINLAQLAIGVLGVLSMTSEYATGSIKLTFGATPQRRLLLAAKVACFSAVVGIVSVISCLTSFLICQALLAPRHAGVSLTDPGVLRAVLGGAAGTVPITAPLCPQPLDGEVPLALQTHAESKRAAIPSSMPIGSGLRRW